MRDEKSNVSNRPGVVDPKIPAAKKRASLERVRYIRKELLSRINQINLALVLKFVINFKLHISFTYKFHAIGLYHPPDGVTNLRYNLLFFLTRNKIILYEEGASF
jgi:hypothetical protein